LSEETSEEEKLIFLRRRDLDELLRLNDLLVEQCSELIQKNRSLTERAARLRESLTPARTESLSFRRGSFGRVLKTIFSFSYRNLFRRRWRTLLTVLSLIATVTGFVCTANISQSIGFDLTSGEAERALFAGIDVGYPYYCDVIVAPEHPWWYNLPIGEPFRSPSSLIPEQLLWRVRNLPGVEWVQPYIGDIKISFSASSLSQDTPRQAWLVRHGNGEVDRFSSDILMTGIDPQIELDRLGKRIIFHEGGLIEGSGLRVMVGYNFAQTHGLSIGDTIIISAERHLCVHNSPGKLRETRFRSVWQSFWAWYENRWQEYFGFSINKEITLTVEGIFWTSTPYDNHIVADYRDMQEIFDFGGRLTALFVKLSSDLEMKDTLESLWSLPDVEIYMPLLRKRYTTGQDRVGSAFSGVAPTRFVTIANMQNIIVSEVAASLFIGTVVYTSVYERRWEIGLLKALGFGSTFILSTLMLEALILGLFAGIMGFLFSSMLSVLSTGIWLSSDLFIPLLYSHIPAIPLKLTLDWSIMAVGLSMGTSLISSLIPAFMASRLPPVEAMRRG